MFRRLVIAFIMIIPSYVGTQSLPEDVKPVRILGYNNLTLTTGVASNNNPNYSNLSHWSYDYLHDWDDKGSYQLLSSDQVWLLDYPLMTGTCYITGLLYENIIFGNYQQECDQINESLLKKLPDMRDVRGWELEEFRDDTINGKARLGKIRDIKPDVAISVNLLNMHALIKEFESIIPPNNITVAHVDGGKVFYRTRSGIGSGFDNVNYPILDHVSDSTPASHPPGHSFRTLQVLGSPSTKSPSNPNPYIVGSVYSSSNIFFEGYYSPNDDDGRIQDKYQLDLIDIDDASKRLTADFLTGPEVGYLVSSQAKEIRLDASTPSLACGFNSNCVFRQIGTTGTFDPYNWKMDRTGFGHHPMPSLLNYSFATSYKRNAIEMKYAEDPLLAKEMYACGGFIKQLMHQDLSYGLVKNNQKTIIIAAHANDLDKINSLALDCPGVIGVAGYDMLKSYPEHRTEMEDVHIAQSHDINLSLPNKGKWISSIPRTVSVPYGRFMHDSKDSIDETKWEYKFLEGNSFSTPLVTGLVAELMARWPKQLPELNIQDIYNLLNYGVFRRAVVPNMFTSYARDSIPIINFACAMASVAVANLRVKSPGSSINTIYQKLGGAKAYSIFSGKDCDNPQQALPLPIDQEPCTPEECKITPPPRRCLPAGCSIS